MQLILKNKIINAEMQDILQQLRTDCGEAYLNYIGKPKNNNIKVTCPFHKGGQERHPSCFVYTAKDDPKLTYGAVHCFTCGKQVPLYKLVGKCLGENDEAGKQWLIDYYGDTVVDTSLLDLDEEIILDKKYQAQQIYLDENILEEYNQYHPYMTYRKLTPEVLRKFKIGYDRISQMITFPVWNKQGKLVMITKRSVNSKQFYIPEGVDKPVYLLNFILQEQINTVYVCESQINTLTLWSWGYPAIGFIGTGSKHQYEQLKHCGIRHYILCLDGDDAGARGTERFIKNMPKDIMISIKQIPQGKDVNDLTKEEFDLLPII